MESSAPGFPKLRLRIAPGDFSSPLFDKFPKNETREKKKKKINVEVCLNKFLHKTYAINRDLEV